MAVILPNAPILIFYCWKPNEISNKTHVILSTTTVHTLNMWLNNFGSYTHKS